LPPFIWNETVILLIFSRGFTAVFLSGADEGILLYLDSSIFLSEASERVIDDDGSPGMIMLSLTLSCCGLLLSDVPSCAVIESA